jgi:hypothetical protein
MIANPAVADGKSASGPSPRSSGGDALRPLEPTADSDAPAAGEGLVAGFEPAVSLPVHAGRLWANAVIEVK